MRELPERLRTANIALAVIAPILVTGMILLRDASEAILQAFGMLMFLLAIALYLVLDERARRRQNNDQ
jgi:hypothetical protein